MAESTEPKPGRCSQCWGNASHVSQKDPGLCHSHSPTPSPPPTKQEKASAREMPRKWQPAEIVPLSQQSNGCHSSDWDTAGRQLDGVCSLLLSQPGASIGFLTTKDWHSLPTQRSPHRADRISGSPKTQKGQNRWSLESFGSGHAALPRDPWIYLSEKQGWSRPRILIPSPTHSCMRLSWAHPAG